MSKKILTCFLILNLLLGGLLRFYQITTNPPGLNSDEVAIGYNAYSVLKTGRDEFGQFLPIAFRSFDDYKPPLYIYLTVPSIAIFGLNEFAVRFSSALLGTLAILVVYFLTDELFHRKKAALLASFLLAISPWHLQFTRTAYETGSLAFFTSLGLWLFLKGQKKIPWIIFSAVIFGLETYLYQAGKVFVPLFVAFSVLILYFRTWRRNVGRLAAFTLVFMLFIIPNLRLLNSSSGLMRFYGTSVFQDPTPVQNLSSYQQFDWRQNDNKSVILFHQRASAYWNNILVGYLSHFRPDFFFAATGSSKINYVPQVGLLYIWELPFLLLGLHFLLKAKNKTPFFLLFSWLLISPLPASVTNNVPSSIRSAAFLPALQIVTGFGLYQSLKILRPLIFVAIPIFLYTFSFYVHMLFVHALIVNSANWYYGYRDVVSQAERLSPKYEQIIVSTNLDVPHIFFLFFSKYDPAKYQQEGGTISGGFAESRNHLGTKYLFHKIDFAKAKLLHKTLLIDLSTNFPADAHMVRKFYYLNGTPSVSFVDEEK